MLSFELLEQLLHCRARWGCVGFDVQELQTDDALVGHDRWRTEPESDFQENASAEEA
jgi:hypothetical protein